MSTLSLKRNEMKKPYRSCVNLYITLHFGSLKKADYESVHNQPFVLRYVVKQGV